MGLALVAARTSKGRATVWIDPSGLTGGPGAWLVDLGQHIYAGGLVSTVPEELLG